VKYRAVTCECGLEPSIENCCGRYISGKELPPTPEALMRSRYSAYATGAIDYIVSTHDPATRDQVDEPSAREWSKNATWEGLEVHEAKTNGDEGTVEFTARYSMKGQKLKHRELALFKKIDGRWLYHDGNMVKPKPVTRETPKVGRNDPCPCGSGKKFKKCCGA
jgi:SEC-C motif-containing protein